MALVKLVATLAWDLPVDDLDAALRYLVGDDGSCVRFERELEPVESGDPLRLIELWCDLHRPLEQVEVERLREHAGFATLRSVSERIHVAPVDGARVLSIGFIYRAANISRSEFGAHWNIVHVPKVLAAQPLFIGYVTNVVTDDRYGWDGLIEQWFVNRDEMIRHVELNRETKPQIMADVPKMLSSADLFVTVDVDWPKPKLPRVIP